MAEDPKPVASFEAGLAELESVVKQLESGDLPLDKALELFEKGHAGERDMPQAARRSGDTRRDSDAAWNGACKPSRSNRRKHDIDDYFRRSASSWKLRLTAGFRPKQNRRTIFTKQCGIACSPAGSGYDRSCV